MVWVPVIGNYESCNNVFQYNSDVVVVYRSRVAEKFFGGVGSFLDVTIPSVEFRRITGD